MLPSESEKAKAARQSSLEKLQKDVERGHEVESLTRALREIRRTNGFTEMFLIAMRRPQR